MRSIVYAFFLVLTLTGASALQTFGQDGERQRPQTKTSKTAEPRDDNDRSLKEKEKASRAQGIIVEVLSESKFVLNPVVRMKIRILAVDAYWEFEPEESRKILSKEFSQLQSVFHAANESLFGELWSSNNGKPTYKGIPIEQVRGQLRRELLAVASSHDIGLARELVAAESKNENLEGAADDHPDEVLATAGNLADLDPEAARRIITDSLGRGVDDLLPFVLASLRETAPAEASALFNQAFSVIKARGDVWEYQRLVPYILPGEMDRLVGGKHYLTDPQRLKDANKMVEYAAEMLYRRIHTEPPAGMSQDDVRREYYLWRNLEAVFGDLKPESLWLVGTRTRQLAASLPQSVQRPTQSPWSEERLNASLAAANASSGTKRDENLQSAAYAAWRFGQGDLDKATAIVEKIGDAQLRDLISGTIYFQAGMKYLSSEGPDYALGLARKINLPGPRIRLFLAVIRNLSSLKAIERTNLLREELLGWLRNCEKNSDTAWALLDYLDTSADDDSERKFTSFEILVRVLNSPNLEPAGKLKNRVYWQPEMHNFRKSLMPLAKADLERGLQLIQTLSNKEIRLQVQAAFCGDYLKTRNQSKKPPEPKKPSIQSP